MSNKIEQEMDAMAENMEKSVQDPAEQLFETIQELGPEMLKSKMADMSDDEKELLKAALEEMNLKKSGTASFDTEADGAGYYQGRVLDGKIQEDQVSDDADEKLVKPEGAKQFHQGSPTEGWSGQAVQDPTDSDNDDNQLVDTGKMKKSLCEEFEGIDELLTDDMLETVVKSFGNDFDMIEDYFNADDAFADELLEKGAKTKMQNGIRVYAEGKNAGRPVGSIRGDKASVKAIARARKKGKISARGAREGIKDVNATKRYEKQREKAGMGASSGKDDKTIQADARERMAEKRHHYREGTESKAKHDKLSRQMQDKVKPHRAKMDEASSKMDRKKDGKPKASKKNAKLKQQYDEARDKKTKAAMEESRKMSEHIKDSNKRSKEMQARLKAKRDKMKKSMEFEMETNLIKAMASDDRMTEMLYKMRYEREIPMEKCMEKLMKKGMDEARCKRLADAAVKMHESKMHKSEDVEPKQEDVEKGAFKEMAIEEEQNLENTQKAEKMNKEEDQLSDTDEATEGKPRVKDPEGNNQPAKDNKAAQDNVDNMNQGKMKKSVEWGNRNDLFKSDRGGRNHHFSVNEYYDNALAKSEGKEEDLNKSDAPAEGQGPEKDDINDMIEKSMDRSNGFLNNEAQIAKAKEAQNGKLVKSFTDKEIAEALGLTEEEAKEILG